MRSYKTTYNYNHGPYGSVTMEDIMCRTCGEKITVGTNDYYGDLVDCSKCWNEVMDRHFDELEKYRQSKEQWEREAPILTL